MNTDETARALAQAIKKAAEQHEKDGVTLFKSCEWALADDPLQTLVYLVLKAYWNDALDWADQILKPKPIERWINVYENGPGGLTYSTREDALDGRASSQQWIKTVRLVEDTREEEHA